MNTVKGLQKAFLLGFPVLADSHTYIPVLNQKIFFFDSSVFVLVSPSALIFGLEIMK